MVYSYFLNTEEELEMENIYVGIFIQGGLIDYVTTGTDKEAVIQEMIDVVNHYNDFDEEMDQATVFLNHIYIWNYEK
jgi:hypothetical protein